MKKLQLCDCHLKPTVSDAIHMNLKVNTWGLRPLNFKATGMSEFVVQPSLLQRSAALIVSLHDQSTNLAACSSIGCFILLLILLQNVGISGACSGFPCRKRLRQSPQSLQVARHDTQPVFIWSAALKNYPCRAALQMCRKHMINLVYQLSCASWSHSIVEYGLLFAY